MKRFIALLLALLMLLSMVACGEESTGKKKKKETTSEEETNTTQSEGEDVAFKADLVQYITVAEDPYEFFFFKKDGKIGAVDKNGKIIIPAEYASLRLSSVKAEEINNRIQWTPIEETAFLAVENPYGQDGYWVNRDGSLEKGILPGYGGNGWRTIYWDKQNNNAHAFCFMLGGDLINHYTYTYDIYLKESSSTTFIFIQCLDRWEIKDYLGNVIELEEKYENLTDDDYYRSKEFSPTLTNEKYGLYDVKTGTMSTDFVYDDYFIVNGKIALVSIDGKWRLVDQEGNFVNDCVYDNPKENDQNYLLYVYKAFKDYNGFVVVKMNGKYGLLNSEGEQILEPKYKNISHVSPDGLYWVQNETGTWDLMQIDR